MNWEYTVTLVFELNLQVFFIYFFLKQFSSFASSYVHVTGTKNLFNILDSIVVAILALLVSEKKALKQKLKASNRGFGLQLILCNSILILLIYNMLSTYHSLGSPNEVNTLG